ncbi:hypothetical protein [Streptomyces cinerochromogenes]|uniref:hypothetical protein n=1 Tax=Streptomyces cinerochromogenes TaxID=66422 RepID=UPI00166F9EC9|nr:hypothetical protein [Streptomyces cinerochromogenes]GGS66849.1 hypothetical protein GCM10010206_31380 [Streptomyces cinerochromogenes]
MKTRTSRYVVAALLAGCCTLVSCGSEHAGAGAGRGGPSAPRWSAADGECAGRETPDTTDDDGGPIPDSTSDDDGIPDVTSDDDEFPDTTSDDQEIPDTTSDDQEIPDTTSDDQELPDRTSDDQGPPGDGTTDDTTDDGGVPDVGPHRWFSMTRDFRAYLKGSASKKDTAIAAHVEKVCVRMPGDGRTEASVWVDYGVWEDDELQHAAEVFARWRKSVYGDRGHVDVLAPAKMTADRDW